MASSFETAPPRARVGNRVPEHVYIDGKPVWTAPSPERAAEIVDLLNGGYGNAQMAFDVWRETVMREAVDDEDRVALDTAIEIVNELGTDPSADLVVLARALIRMTERVGELQKPAQPADRYVGKSDRDYDADPYDGQEARAAAALRRVFGDEIGTGPDPVGFVIGSYETWAQEAPPRDTDAKPAAVDAAQVRT